MEAAVTSDAHDAELRQQLIQQLRSGDGLDAQAAYEVSERGWTH
jgi:hypothetical protein